MLFLLVGDDMGIGCGVRFDGGKGLTSGMVQVRVEGEGQE